jgi:peptidoglycan hydrolase-like protein with peptidoglycan-binding domain
MPVLCHNDLENILLTVKELRLAGMTARKIADELDRLGYKRPAPKDAWQTQHAIRLIQELRRRGQLPPLGKKVKAQYRAPAKKPASHSPKN